MPPPVKVSSDALLDAARDLALSGGAIAASARAVSLATGASSGSIYHRFPRRDDLVAATWLRAQDRFLAAFLPVLSGGGAEAGPEAAAVVVSWSLGHRDDASLLLRFGLRDLVRGEVSPGVAEHAGSNQDRVAAALMVHAARTGTPRADVTLALVDLPYAATRRLLQDESGPTDADAVDAVRRAARLILGL